MLYLDKLFSKIEKIYQNYIFEFFIYENNSTDNTKLCIKNFANNRNCEFLIEDITNNNMKQGISIERGEHMANIRNKLKDYHGKLDSDYVLLLDCDVVFLPNTLEQLINTINDEIVMATPFCICWAFYFENNKAIHYYDSLAVISKDDISYKESDNTCLFKRCNRCISHRKINNINLKPASLFDDDKIIEVNSCFGSLALIKTHVYNNIKWDNTVCEHHSFCKNASQYGKIVINPHIKTVTTIPKFDNYFEIESELEKITKSN
jgi:GT2 family glycosyltransferase